MATVVQNVVKSMRRSCSDLDGDAGAASSGDMGDVVDVAARAGSIDVNGGEPTATPTAVAAELTSAWPVELDAAEPAAGGCRPEVERSERRAL